MGKIPEEGEWFKYDKYTFIVDEATERSVEKVSISSTLKINVK